MTRELENLISAALASGEPTFHEAVPEDFGPDTPGRWMMLSGCLEALLEAHPGLSISLVGMIVTLNKFGLSAASVQKVGRFRVTVWPGQTDKIGAIRIAFCPKANPLSRSWELASTRPRTGSALPPLAAAVPDRAEE